MKGRWSLLFKAGLSLGVLVILARRADLAQIGALLGAIDAATVVTALVLVVVQTLVTAGRWRLIMRGVGVALGARAAVATLFASLCINQCLPSYIGGDAYRIYRLYRGGHALAAATQGVLIDRVSALLALVLMLAASLPALFARFPDTAVRAGMVALLVAGVGGGMVFLACDLLPSRWGRRMRMVGQVMALSAAARRVLLTPATGLVVGPLAIVVHLLGAATLFVLAAGLALPLGLLDCVVLTPPVLLLSAVPISIAGWGVREGVMVGALGMLGIDTERALALSLLLGLTLLANGVLGVWPLVRDSDLN